MHLINIAPEEVFQAVAEPTRIRILRLYAVTGEEACLCELVDSLLEPQYKLSRHLKVLRAAGLLTARKEGRWVYHRVVRGFPHLKYLFRMIETIPDSERTFEEDLARFEKRLRFRVNGRCEIGIQTPKLMEREA